MSGGLYSHTTRAAGTVLTASIYNTDHQNHISNLYPAMIDDYSATLAEMRTVRDPGEAGTEVLSTSLAEELQAIRQILTEITGETYWFYSPDTNIAAINLLTDKISATDDETFVKKGSNVVGMRMFID